MIKLVTALGGSRLFKLNTECSDWDYFAIVSGAGAEQLPIDCGTEEIHGSDDYFLHRLDAFYNIQACASPLIVPTYDSIISYENRLLYEFLTGNATQLADIAPNSTYQISLMQVEIYIESQLERSYSICARLLGMIYQRYYTGDMLSARELPELWKTRYFEAKRGEVSASQVTRWLKECKSNSFQNYYAVQPDNRVLHDQYKTIIDQILGGT